MGKDTAISWCHHTHNLWEGCFKVSPGCKHCYAEAMNAWLKRGANWGLNAPRHTFKAEHYRKPYAWNKAAKAAGQRERVFCGSVMDIMEIHPDRQINRMMDELRDQLWQTILETEWLDWLLLTKRPENFEQLLPWASRNVYRDPFPNVWLGVTAEDDEHARKRIPTLRATPAAVRYVSYEPALGRIDWDPWLKRVDHCGTCGAEHLPQVDDRCLKCGATDALISTWGDEQYSKYLNGRRYDENPIDDGPPIDWVIFGDESGRRRRPAELEWARETRDACAIAGVAFHFKQWCGAGIDGVEGDRNAKRVIHLPILDGVQHAAFPEVIT